MPLIKDPNMKGKNGFDHQSKPNHYSDLKTNFKLVFKFFLLSKSNIFLLGREVSKNSE